MLACCSTGPSSPKELPAAPSKTLRLFRWRCHGKGLVAIDGVQGLKIQDLSFSRNGSSFFYFDIILFGRWDWKLRSYWIRKGN